MQGPHCGIRASGYCSGLSFFSRQTWLACLFVVAWYTWLLCPAVHWFHYSLSKKQCATWQVMINHVCVELKRLSARKIMQRRSIQSNAWGLRWVVGNEANYIASVAQVSSCPFFNRHIPMPKLHLHAVSSVWITLNMNETISVALVTFRYCMATSHGFGHRLAGGFMLVLRGTSGWWFELFARQGDCRWKKLC